jgi:hypothetical protein
MANKHGKYCVPIFSPETWQLALRRQIMISGLLSKSLDQATLQEWKPEYEEVTAPTGSIKFLPVALMLLTLPL